MSENIKPSTETETRTLSEFLSDYSEEHNLSRNMDHMNRMSPHGAPCVNEVAKWMRGEDIPSGNFSLAFQKTYGLSKSEYDTLVLNSAIARTETMVHALKEQVAEYDGLTPELILTLKGIIQIFESKQG